MTADAPEPLPDPPPPIRQTYDGVGGLIQQNDAFTPSNVLSQQALAPFNPSFQGLMKNVKINRPSVPDPRLPAGAVGWSNAQSGVNVLRSDSPSDEVDTAQHELLHTIAATSPYYRAEDQGSYPRLRQAMAAYPEIVNEFGNDYQHAFVRLAQRALTNPWSVPEPIRRYFAPLLPSQPPFLQRALNAMSVYGRGPR